MSAKYALLTFSFSLSGTTNGPDNELLDTMRCSKLTSLQSSLGKEPAKACIGHPIGSCCKTDAERRTVESASGHLELLEVRESTPSRRDSTSELVGVVIAISKIEDLERNTTPLSTGASAPVSRLNDMSRTVKLVRLPSASVSSPERVQNKRQRD